MLIHLVIIIVFLSTTPESLQQDAATYEEYANDYYEAPLANDDTTAQFSEHHEYKLTTAASDVSPTALISSEQGHDYQEAQPSVYDSDWSPVISSIQGDAAFDSDITTAPATNGITSSSEVEAKTEPLRYVEPATMKEEDLEGSGESSTASAVYYDDNYYQIVAQSTVGDASYDNSYTTAISSSDKPINELETDPNQHTDISQAFTMAAAEKTEITTVFATTQESMDITEMVSTLQMIASTAAEEGTTATRVMVTTIEHAVESINFNQTHQRERPTTVSKVVATVISLLIIVLITSTTIHCCKKRKSSLKISRGLDYEMNGEIPLYTVDYIENDT